MCNPVSASHPDLLLARGVHEGYEWEITGNRMGYRCGYVRVPQGHPWHGQDYDSIDADVHGGLTFAEPDVHCGKGGEDDAWWVGFDCAHLGDAADPDLPGYDARTDIIGYGDATIKTAAYVEAECRSLADQARAAA
jgi:hypothetical protein